MTGRFIIVECMDGKKTWKEAIMVSHIVSWRKHWLYDAGALITTTAGAYRVTQTPVEIEVLIRKALS